MKAKTKPAPRPRKATLRRPNLPRAELRDATLAELLNYAANHGDEDIARGILRATRIELDVFATLALCAVEGNSLDAQRQAGPLFEMFARRLDVALELLDRQRGKS